MHEHETLAILRGQLPRMPGASPEHLAGPVTRAWNGHHLGRRTTRHAQRAVVDTVWPFGYHRGATLGHHTATEWWQNQALDARSQLTRVESEDRSRATADARTILMVTATVAASVGGDLPRSVTTGPDETDHQVARRDGNDLSPAGLLAAGLRVGWNRSLQRGFDDATALASQKIAERVVDLVGEATVLGAHVDRLPAPRWLINAYGAALQLPMPTHTPTVGRLPAAAGFARPVSVDPTIFDPRLRDQRGSPPSPAAALPAAAITARRTR